MDKPSARCAVEVCPNDHGRLAVILAADVVGYFRLVSTNETDELARLAQLRKEIIEPNIANHSGRLFKVMGDGFLAEVSSFSSVGMYDLCRLITVQHPADHK